MTHSPSRPNESLVVSLLAHADSHPERVAVAQGQLRATYAEFGWLIRANAMRLAQLYSQPGAHILLSGPNNAMWAAAYFAIHMAGCVAVPVDHEVPVETLRELANDADAAGAILLDRRSDIPLGLPCIDLLVESNRSNGAMLFSPRCSSSVTADLLYTTGTTGNRKGVLLSHAQIANAAQNIHVFVQEREDDIEVVPIPLSHSFALGRLRVMALVGHNLYLEPGMRNPAQTLKTILDIKATGFAMVPAGIEMILRLTKDRLADARDHLRYIEIGSASMSLTTKRRLMELLPKTRICHHYGLTEASRAAFIEYHSDTDRLDSIGRASPNAEIAIVDENDNPVPDGEVGEIAVRGPMVMQEYWRQPELTGEVLRNGWLHTGDSGWRSADGYLYLTGRKTDVINVAGKKVSPEEVEAAINEHPSVSESAVVGVSDPQGLTGECIKACLVLRKSVSDEELVGWLRGKLEEHKIPRIWQRVEQLAKTPSGKMQRHLM